MLYIIFCLNLFNLIYDNSVRVLLPPVVEFYLLRYHLQFGQLLFDLGLLLSYHLLLSTALTFEAAKAKETRLVALLLLFLFVFIMK